MEPKYALYPSHVTSRTDGDRHYIGAPQLARLYRVPMGECLVISDEDYRRPDRRGKLALAEKLIALWPRYDGNYKLPEQSSDLAIS